MTQTKSFFTIQSDDSDDSKVRI